MGKGDKKTKRGKIIMGSFGVRRPRKSEPASIKAKVEKVEKPAKPVKEKAPAKAKAVKEEVAVAILETQALVPETPVVEAIVPVIAEAPAESVEETPKATRKKAPPKPKEDKEEKPKSKS